MPTSSIAFVGRHCTCLVNVKFQIIVIGSIQSDESLVYKYVSVLRGRDILISTWHYRIHMPYSSTAPVLIFQLAPVKRASHEFDIIRPENCFKRVNTSTNQIYVGHNPTYIEVKPDSRWPCVLEGQGYITCAGQVRWASAVPTKWAMRFGYECSKGSGAIEVNYNVTALVHDSVECKPVATFLSDYRQTPGIEDARARCGKHYSHYSDFNMFGFTGDDLEWLANLFSLITVSSCYQHLEELVCRAAIPECVGGRVVHSCIEMCHELHTVRA